MSDDEADVDEEELRELLDAAIGEIGEQSDVDPNVYYIDREEMIDNMGGLNQVLCLTEEERQERGIKPAGHSMEDLQDMPDHVTYEVLVADEYGEVLDRRWLDGVEKTSTGHNFYGGAYLIADEGEPEQPVLREYILVGTSYTDKHSLGWEVSHYPVERYDTLDDFVEDKFAIGENSD